MDRAARDTHDMKKRKLDALIQQLAGAPGSESVRVARTEAKWRAPAHPALRRALAEHYRRLGDAAQAGRWGIVFPGWAKPHEIAHLRRFLLSNADGGDFVRFQLGLRRSEPVPHELADLVASRFVERGPKDNGGSMLLGCAGALLAMTGVVTALSTTIGVLWRSLAGEPLEAGPLRFVIAFGLATVGALATLPTWRASSDDAKAVDRGFAVRRALDLLDEQPAEGRVMLRALVRNFDDPTVRRALVEDARRRGRPGDAGRWGCTEAGLTTPAERDAYATVLLRKSGRDPLNLLMDLSAVTGEDRTPGDLNDVARRIGASAPDPLPELGIGPLPRLRWWFIAALALPLGAICAVMLPASAHSISAGTVATLAAAWTVLCVIASSARERSHNTRLFFAACSVVLAVTATAFGIAAL